MSDATAQIPAPQSASQLSENIGDVLASIRRLIAQDEAAEAAEAARVPAAPEPERVTGLHRAPRAEGVARRRDILAEAQALTRRSEAAFGQMAQSAPPLTLGAAERVASVRAALPPAGANSSSHAGAAEGPVSPLVLTAPLPRAVTAASIATPSAPTVAGASAAGLPARSAPSITTTHQFPAVEAATHADEAKSMSGPATFDASTAVTSQAPAPDSGPARDAGATGPAPVAPVLIAATPPAMPRIVATVAPQPAATPVEAIPSTSFTPASAPIAARTPPEPPATAAPTAAPAPAPVAEEEDSTASILREMIRDVVRQELQGDPAGRMPNDLRSMIMREVAQVLTQGGRRR